VISILYFFSIFDVLVTCAIYLLVLLTVPGIISFSTEEIVVHNPCQKVVIQDVSIQDKHKIRNEELDLQEFIHNDQIQNCFIDKDKEGEQILQLTSSEMPSS
jgi:hypothetical protein